MIVKLDVIKKITWRWWGDWGCLLLSGVFVGVMETSELGRFIVDFLGTQGQRVSGIIHL